MFEEGYVNRLVYFVAFPEAVFLIFIIVCSPPGDRFLARYIKNPTRRLIAQGLIIALSAFILLELLFHYRKCYPCK